MGNDVCEKHSEIVASLQEGAETMAVLKASISRVEGLLSVMAEKQEKNMMQNARIEAIVTNGLSHSIKEIKEKIDFICTEYGKRIQVLESFSWFRDWVTNLRNFTFFTLLKIAFFITVMYGFFYGGREVIESVVKHILR